MLPDASGTRPQVANDKKSLGVQVEGEGPGDPDIPVEGGMVRPATGGMSVSPSKVTLPPHRIPKQFVGRYPDARGSNKYVCWRMGDGPFADAALAPRLFMRLDRTLPDHGLIEPDAAMPLDEYRGAIADTQSSWVAEAWNDGDGP